MRFLTQLHCSATVLHFVRSAIYRCIDGFDCCHVCCQLCQSTMTPNYLSDFVHCPAEFGRLAVFGWSEESRANARWRYCLEELCYLNQVGLEKKEETEKNMPFILKAKTIQFVYIHWLFTYLWHENKNHEIVYLRINLYVRSFLCNYLPVSTLYYWKNA